MMTVQNEANQLKKHHLKRFRIRGLQNQQDLFVEKNQLRDLSCHKDLNHRMGLKNKVEDQIVDHIHQEGKMVST